MIPKIEYGQKDIRVGHVFEIGNWLVHCTYSSAQVLRFNLYKGKQELELQKFLSPRCASPGGSCAPICILPARKRGKN